MRARRKHTHSKFYVSQSLGYAGEGYTCSWIMTEYVSYACSNTIWNIEPRSDAWKTDGTSFLGVDYAVAWASDVAKLRRRNR